MNKAEQFIQSRLQERADKGILRALSSTNFPIDFSSNDYLGFARSAELKIRTATTLGQIPHYKNGATGSRLLSGNHNFTEETEQAIANFHQAEAGLIFNSGYDANVGLISSLAQRGDTVIADELIHASLIDGARLSHANRYTFKHNDLNELEAKLKVAKGNIYVLIESVYSMDGDIAPLVEINKLCHQYQAQLIVDEAHALGVFGDHGVGLVQMLGLEHEVFARIVTFGKALGCHGAIVLGSTNLRTYLINFARSFVYTTAAPIHAIAAIHSAYQMLIKTDYTTKIKSKITLYLNLLKDSNIPTIQSTSAIQTVLFNNSSEAKAAAQSLQIKGIDVRAILSPTVAEGKERLRICLHLFNSDLEIKKLVNELKTLKHE
ncbi:aminotransferase class I/II-fold pyridoxal phosphate-dependent enzyme [Pedobacter hiemivivus]|uniref:Pyridoxal phosphate-dependent aminotransferase family protein n=1 Tax=Pedobacter hiemivivus TaxID=2530454 RepID=A0A4R0MCS5_9SPHI|nr:pyridoxal phosphate-dependent aminotransferase family protein [Pedobacter hiemivivus]TCC84140.1 pyridoxal phosphate-dependent aminotransferase family protein [Pedobacter hiemivivus]